MTGFKAFVADQLSHIISGCDKIEVRANVSESGYSFEFFATINGKRKQCFDMIDEGLFNEKDFDVVAKAVAQYARNTVDFKKGEINKYSIVID